MKNSKIYTKNDRRGLFCDLEALPVFQGLAKAKCSVCECIFETHVVEFWDGTEHTDYCCKCGDEYEQFEKSREERSLGNSPKKREEISIYDGIDLNSSEASKIDKVCLAKSVSWVPSERGKKFNLYLRGDSGAGKSLAIHKLKKKFVKSRRSIYSVNGAGFGEQLNENGTSFQYSEFVRKLKNIDVLFIDEFAKGFTNALTGPILFDIINSRIEERKPTVLASRYNADQIIESVRSDPTIGEDLVRRIRDYFEVITFRRNSGNVVLHSAYIN